MVWGGGGWCGGDDSQLGNFNGKSLILKGRFLGLPYSGR